MRSGSTEANCGTIENEVSLHQVSMVWFAGKKLFGDRYTLEGQLGEGGFGITYAARKHDGKRVVIKTLKDELVNHRHFPKFCEKFRDEALMLSLCRHPNIVQIDNAFSEGKLPCISMEYVEGEDLWKRVEDKGMLSEKEALQYIWQIGEALSFIHSEKGLLHRDVKPHNIIVRQGSSEAVLIDFGLARGFIPDITQHHTTYHTPAFAPPEQLIETGRRGEYTDVYALAATLYYLVTKTPPSTALERTWNHPLKPPSQLNPNISVSVHEAIIQGMAMEAEKRPQSVKQWLAMLPQPTPAQKAQPKIVSPTIPSPPPVPLISAKGVDYRQLEKLLASGQWKEADGETAKKMLEVAGRQEEGWLRVEDIDNFPCEDLRTIDQLWVKYSNGRFGFSVQKRIYQGLGGTRDYNPKVWDAFGDAVGWRVNEKWLCYSDIKFKTKAAKGHLPTVYWEEVFRGIYRFNLNVFGGFWVGFQGSVEYFRCLLSRRDL